MVLVIVVFLCNSFWVLLFDNLLEKGCNIFFIIRKMMFWFILFIIFGDVVLDFFFIKRFWKYMYFLLMGWMIKE